jgi:hypothetical protein
VRRHLTLDVGEGVTVFVAEVVPHLIVLESPSELELVDRTTRITCNLNCGCVCLFLLSQRSLEWMKHTAVTTGILQDWVTGQSSVAMTFKFDFPALAEVGTLKGLVVAWVLANGLPDVDIEAAVVDEEELD